MWDIRYSDPEVNVVIKNLLYRSGSLAIYRKGGVLYSRIVCRNSYGLCKMVNPHKLSS